MRPRFLYALISNVFALYLCELWPPPLSLCRLEHWRALLANCFVVALTSMAGFCPARPPSEEILGAIVACHRGMPRGAVWLWVQKASTQNAVCDPCDFLAGGATSPYQRVSSLAKHFASRLVYVPMLLAPSLGAE